MKETLGSILVAIIWTALAVMSLATLISFGYFMYLWGSVSLAINVAAWSAFILWLKLEAISISVFLLSAIILSFL